MSGKYRVEIRLEYDQSPDDFLNLSLLPDYLTHPASTLDIASPQPMLWQNQRQQNTFWDSYMDLPHRDELANGEAYFRQAGPRALREVPDPFGGEGGAHSGRSYFEDPMFYINGGIGVASTGATIKGGYHLSNELYHYTKSSGNLHLRGGKYWNNPFVIKSKAAITAWGGVWRSAGTKLVYAGIAITTGDALLSGEFRTSQGVNVAMTTLAIAVPGVGSVIAGVYFVADISLMLSTGQGIGDRIDAATGGTHELYEGFY